MNAKTEIMSDHSFQTSVGFRTWVEAKSRLNSFENKLIVHLGVLSIQAESLELPLLPSL